MEKNPHHFKILYIGLLRNIYVYICQSSLYCIALYVLAPTIKTTELWWSISI